MAKLILEELFLLCLLFLRSECKVCEGTCEQLKFDCQDDLCTKTGLGEETARSKEVNEGFDTGEELRQALKDVRKIVSLTHSEDHGGKAALTGLLDIIVQHILRSDQITQQLHDRTTANEREIRKLHVQNKRLEAQLRTAKNKIRRQNSTIQELTKEVVRNKAEIRYIEDEIAKLQTAVSSITHKQTETETSLDTAVENVSSLQAESVTLAKALDALWKEIQNVGYRTRTLENDVDKKTGEIRQLEWKNAELSHGYKHLQETNQQLTRETEKLKYEVSGISGLLRLKRPQTDQHGGGLQFLRSSGPPDDVPVKGMND